MNVLDDNVLSFESNEGQVFSLDSNLTTGTIWAVSDVSGIPLLRASAGATIGIAEYTGSTVGIGTDRPIYKFQTVGLAAFASTNGFAPAFLFDNNYAAGSNILQVRDSNSIRFYASNNSSYAGLKYTGATQKTYTLPSDTPGTGTSVLQSDTSGTLSWVPMTASGGSAVTSVAAGTGLTISGGPITSSGTIRARRNHRIQFGAALNPVAGADSAVFEIPFDYSNGTSSMTFRMRRAHVRVETASATGSSFRIEKYAYSGGTGISFFDTTSTGSTTNILATQLSINGATTYEASTTSFAGSHVTAVSGDKLRLFWLQASNTQYNFSINLIMEEDV